MFLVTVKNGDKETIIHRNDSSPVKLTEAQIKTEANAISAFDFAMLPNNPGYSLIHPLTTQVMVRRVDTGRILFDGRVISPKNEMEESGVLKRSYTCEGALGYLHDVTPGYTTYSGKSDEVIRKLIAFFNGQVEAYKQIKLGDLVKGVKQVKLETTPDKDLYDTLRELCVTTMGYDMRLRSTDQGRFLDVKSELGERGKTVIQLGRNLKSLSIEDDPTSIATRVIPLGKTLEDQSTDAEAPEKRLTLPETYLDIPELKQLYGIQTKTWTFDDADTVAKLRTEAQAKIKAQQSVRRKFTLSALDLSLIGKAPEDFTLFNSYRVVNPVMQLDSYLKVTGQTIDLVSPETADLTIGDKFKSGTDYAVEASKREQELSRVYQNVRNLKSYVSKQKAELESKLTDSDKQIKELLERLEELEAGLSGGYYDGLIIDVSEWQGVIDWTKVVAAGLALPIIRVQHGSDHQDYKYAENIQKCLSAGHTNYAVYAYFAGLSAADAQQEAKDFYSRTQTVVSGKAQPQFYMIDVEESTMSNMRGGVEAYMTQLNNLGVPDSQIVLYVANHLYDSFNLNVNRAASVVVPSYGANDGTVSGSTKPTHPYDLWQYTSTGSVSGITGNVDLNTDPSERFKEKFLDKR